KNMGGQLIPSNSLSVLLRDIKSGSIRNWDGVHAFYRLQSDRYPDDKIRHAFASLLEILGIEENAFNRKMFLDLLRQALATRSWMVNSIGTSRARDHSSPFRQMVYDSKKEMDAVIGKLKDNAFILQQEKAGLQFRDKVNTLIRLFSKD
ncbi:MAG TPA: hypothetical protein VLJ68_03335, partial [Chitinophagaceae bacterium]|nr:hypothetical protein [Chitinophagaceae bacterium]